MKNENKPSGYVLLNADVIHSRTFRMGLITVAVFLISAILFVATDTSPGAFSEFVATIAFIGIGVSLIMSVAGFLISFVKLFHYGKRVAGLYGIFLYSIVIGIITWQITLFLNSALDNIAW